MRLIDDALGRLSGGTRYVAAFREHRYDVRATLGASDAEEDLHLALTSANSDRHRQLLMVKLVRSETIPSLAAEGE